MAVIDYDFNSGHTRTASADRLLASMQENCLQVDWILEPHADHLTTTASPACLRLPLKTLPVQR